MSKQEEKKEHETFVRFREFVKDKNIDVAQRLGVEPATVTNWRWRGIAHDKIIPLANIYGLDAHYIATGEHTIQNQLNNHGYIGGSVSQSVVNHDAKQSANDDWVMIADNAMSPTFVIGDTVRIDKAKAPQAGSYVLVQYNGQVMLRKYRPKYDDDGKAYIQLVASNEDYPVMDSRHHDFVVAGAAVEFNRKLV